MCNKLLPLCRIFTQSVLLGELPLQPKIVVVLLPGIRLSVLLNHISSPPKRQKAPSQSEPALPNSNIKQAGSAVSYIKKREREGKVKTQMCSWGIGHDTVRTVHFEEKVAFLWLFLFCSFVKTLRPDWLVRQFIDSLATSVNLSNTRTNI